MAKSTKIWTLKENDKVRYFTEVPPPKTKGWITMLTLNS